VAKGKGLRINSKISFVNCTIDMTSIKLAMVKSYCVPLLTYCLCGLSLTRRCVQHLKVCWSNCFRGTVYSDKIDMSRSKIDSFSVMSYHSNSCMIWQSGNHYSIPHVFRFQLGFCLHFRTMSCLTLPKIWTC